MTSAVAGRGLKFGPEDYDAIEWAVMETPRGRWFLAERDKRQRIDETRRILDALKKLEATLAAPSAQPPAAAADPARGAEDRDTAGSAAALDAAASAESAGQALALKTLKYFKQNEAIFMPAAAAPAPASQPAEVPAVNTGARLAIYRDPPSNTAIADNPSASPLAESRQLEPEALPAPAPSPGLEPAITDADEKRRIVIIRRAAAEPMEIPLQSQLAAGPAP